MKTTEELLKEKEDLKKQLEEEKIEGTEYTKKEKELDAQLKSIKDNDSIGKNIKIIKICVMIITAILCLYTLFVAVTWISSMSYSDDYDDWSDGDGIEYSDDEMIFEDQ